jgi:hypothetical protein
MSKPSLLTYGGNEFTAGYPGQIADQEEAITDSRTNEGATAIDFGVAVVLGTVGDRTCKVMSSDSDKILGISVRRPIHPASSDGNNTVNYAQYKSVEILRAGVIWVLAAEAVREGDQVLALTAGGSGNTSAGSFGGSKGGVAGSGRIDVPNAVWEDTTASGAVGRIRIMSPISARRTTT